MEKETGSDSSKSPGDAAAAACLANAGALFGGLHQYDPRLLQATASQMMSGQRGGVAHSPLNAMGLNSASATWWQMASHLAAQDYLARLQASGISFPGMTGGADGVLPPSFPILSQQHTGSSAKSKIPEPPNRESFVLSESVSSSILGGVRLPPDTEIIKYTSSIVGPKIPGTTNRGRKKTISLDPPSVSLLATHASTGLPIEHSPTALLTDRSMMSNGGCSSAQDADAPLNLSMKPNSSSNSSSSVSNSSSPNNNLAPLDFSSHSSSSSSSSRISRRKPGPKPRRLAPPPSSYPIPPTDPSRLSPFYGTDDETTHHKDGRPRNLGRGISKPKKNTVASLLAQSRALGLTGDIDLSKYPSLKANILQQQLEALTERAKTEDRHDKKPLSVPNITTKTSETSHVLNFSTSQRVEGLSHNEESGSAGDKRGSPALESDYEFQNGGGKRRRIDSDLLTPLAKGWRRDTFISGFSPAGELNGDVAYTSPCETTFTRTQELLMYLKERNITDLNASNFSFNPRTLVGDYHQADGSGGFLKLSKQDIKNKMAVLKAVVAKPPIEQRIEAEPVPPKPLQENSAIAMLKNMKLPTPDRKKEVNSIKEAPPSVSVSVSVSVSIPPSPSTTSTTTSTPIAAPIVTPTPASTITTTPLSITMTSSSSSTSPGLTQKETIADKQKKKEKREQQFMEMYIQELNKQREMLYTVELERERRRQHMALVKALEIRKRFEEREKKRLEVQAEKIASREKRIEERRLEIGLLYQIRKPTEDMEITDSKPLPVLERIPGLQLSGQTFGDLLMVHEFLNNFGETLGFDMDSLPTLSSLQLALLGDEEAEEELLSVMTHLIICAIEDPGIPNPARHITILGQSLKQADITHSNISEILRVYLYANATGEIKSLSGACFEREREKRVTDHLNNLCEETNGQKESCISASKNAPFFEALYDNPTFKMSEWLKTKSFVALSPEQKSQILASICHELLQNKAVNKQIDNSMEEVAQHKRDRWATETKIRKLKQFIGRKLRQGTIIPGTGNPLETPGAEAEEEEEDDEAADSDNEINSEGTQPEEDEDRKLSVDELNRKLEKLIRQSEQNVQSLSEAATQLRATCFGEDRYFRRYWTLPAAGGIFVEGMESAEPEILQKMVEEEEQYAKENGTDDLQDTADAATPVPILEKVDDIKDETPEEPMEGNDDNLEPPVLVKEEDVVIKSEDSPQEVPSLTSCTEVENVKSEDVKMEVDEVVTTEVKEEMKEEVVKEEKIEVTEEKEVKTEVKEEKMETDAETKAEEEVKPETDNKSDVEKSEDKLETLSNSSQQSSSATDQAQQTTQTPAEPQAEFGWFTIMPKEPCDPCSVTTSSPGLRYGEGGTTELRIPVFPPPASSPGPPDSPTPLMLTPDEAAQLAYMKEHGAPKKSVRKPIPKDNREGWWRISDMKQLAQLVECLHPRGIRERELKRFITWPSLDQTWDTTLKTVLRPNNGLAKLEGDDITVEDDAKRSEEIALRVDLNVLNQVEVLEEKVASSSMQVKGWKCPNRVSGDGRNWAPAYCASDPDLNPVAIAKQKLAALESAIERRYLKPPLGVSTGEVNHLQNLKNEGETLSPTDYDNIPKGLVTWREAIQKAMTAAQVSMCLHMLEASIAWDRSIMKANCQFCHSGDCEDKLLLCDGCDKGYHTYCFKPKMEKIPEGDWYCYECLNKATGERNCIVCGKKFGRNLIFCDQCPRAYHSDCLQPPLVKIPRSKWSCFNCQSKSPKKRSIRKSNPSTTSTPTISNGRPSTEAPSTPKTSTPIGTQTTAVVPETPTEEPPAKKPVEEPAPVVTAPPEEPVVEPTPTPSAEEINKTNKKTAKELAACKQLLEEMEAHDDAWPFLLPVNTKQFPTYKKVIKSPMDLSIIKKRLQDSTYKSKTDFSNDVRLIFNNCETFNEDDSPVGKAGHGMRLFFESRWTDICNSKS